MINAAAPTVRPVLEADVGDLTDLLNAIIARGGTTAYQQPFAPRDLAERYLLGPDVFSALVASSGDDEPLDGFQVLVRSDELPLGWADVATYVKIGNAGRGVGRALFSESLKAARKLGILSINATIRSDNVSGLAYYSGIKFVDYAAGAAVELSTGERVETIRKRFVIS